MNVESGIEIEHKATSYLTAVDDLTGALQSETKLRALLDRVAAQAKAHEADVTTDAGRKAIASVAYKVACSKTAMDKAGFELGEKFRSKLKAVNGRRKYAVETLQALQDEVREPLTAWETAESERQEKLRDRLAALTPASVAGARSDVIQTELDRIKAIKIDETWDEFQPTAAEQRKNALKSLGDDLKRAQEHEAEQEELRRLKEELAARKAADAAREEAERQEREAAEAARREEERQKAEAKAREEAAAKAAQEAREAAEREAQEREAAAAREAQEKIDAARREAEAAAERERQAEEAKKAAEKAAEEAAARAIEAERERAAEERRREQEAEDRRRADRELRSRVKAEIAAAVLRIGNISGPEGVAEAIIAGEVPHVRAVL